VFIRKDGILANKEESYIFIRNEVKASSKENEHFSHNTGPHLLEQPSNPKIPTIFVEDIPLCY